MVKLKTRLFAFPVLFSLIFILAFSFTGIAVKAEGDDVSGETVYIWDEAAYDGVTTLTDSEKSRLYSEMAECSNETGYSLYIFITDTVGMNSGWENYMQQVAAYFKPANKVLLFISVKEGEHVVCIDSYDADQKGASYFLNSSRLEEIKEDLRPNLTDKEYYEACHKFVNGVSYYSEKDPKFDSLFFKWYVHLAIAIVIAILVVSSQINAMGGKITVDSATYLNDKQSKVIGSFDRYTHTTRRVIHHESKSSSGGGGGHSSSGGSSF